MSFRDDLAKVIAGDSRHSIEAYAFVLESLQLARSRKLRAVARDRKTAGDRRSASSQEAKESPLDTGKSRPKSARVEAIGHVSGQELCESARRLALKQFGFLAGMVLESWGIGSTSDIGDVVYSLIGSGHLEKTPRDRRADFDDVFDFKAAFRPTLASLARDARVSDPETRGGTLK